MVCYQITHVFRDNLLERLTNIIPSEHLDVFFNIPRFWTREAHDELEELLTPRFAFGHSLGPESLEVTTDPILLLDREASTDQRLEQVDRIHRGEETFVFVLAEDARYDDRVLGLRVIVLRDWTE